MNWFSNCSISSLDSKEVLLELLDAVWMSRLANLRCLLVEEVIGSLFSSSSNFLLTISNAILSLDLRLICRVTCTLTKGFSRDVVDFTRFPNWGMTIYVCICINIYIYIYTHLKCVETKTFSRIEENFALSCTEKRETKTQCTASLPSLHN